MILSPYRPPIAVARPLQGESYEPLFPSRFPQSLACRRNARQRRRPPLHAARRTATDCVTLGKSGLKVTRLAFGTGTNNGHVQAGSARRSSPAWFTTPTTAASAFLRPPSPMHSGHARQGAQRPPRESYQLMTKVTTHRRRPPERLRRDAPHLADRTTSTSCCSTQHTPTWAAEPPAGKTASSKRNPKKTILSRGASVHGLPALRQMPGNKWLEVAMIRMNHNGTRMDGPNYEKTTTRQRERSRRRTSSRSAKRAWASSA